MRFDRVDEALDTCETHLQSTDSLGSPIESLLSAALLVIIHAEFEREVEKIVQEKQASIEDESVRNFFGSFVGSAARRTLPRGIESSRIGDFLERFGEQYKTEFRTNMGANPRAETFYNNLISNRNDTAHKSGSNITLMDLKRFYEEGHVVLDFFREILLGFRPG